MPLRNSHEQSNGNAPSCCIEKLYWRWAYSCLAPLWVLHTQRGAFGVARFDYFGQCESLINVERLMTKFHAFFVYINLSDLVF